MTYSLGLDIGGTKIATALLHHDGTVLHTATVPTAGSGPAVIDQIADLVTAHTGQQALSGIGLAVPGDVDPSTGVISSAPNIGWTDLDITGRIAPHLPPRTLVRVNNDANAAAWAEYRFGGHSRGDSFAMITVGTGLGGGFVLNGRLLRGATGAAGEIGHMPLEPSGEACTCGSRGCWERYASGSALHRAAIAAGWDTATAGRDLLAAAATDPAARYLVAGIAGHLVRGISLVTAALNPAQVILGGGLGTDRRFLAIVQEAQQSLETTPPRFRPIIRAATLGPLAGAVGAADLAQEPDRSP